MGRDPLMASGYRTQRAELPEDLYQPLYDRANYAAAGATSVSFFAVPRGGSATLITAGSAASKTKSYRDTNLDNANVVPAKMFKFVGLSLAWVHASYTASTNANDRAQVRDGAYIHFKVIDKDILYLPLVAIPECNPIIATSTTATATSINSTVGGGNAPMYKFPIPITLQPYENFTLSINLDGTVTVTNTLDIYVILHGFMRRPT